MPFFTTPTVRVRNPVGDRLWGRAYLERGVSVLRFGSSYQQISEPESDVIDAADAVFIGGRTYAVSNEEADLLTAAGYGSWVTEDADTPVAQAALMQPLAGLGPSLQSSELVSTDVFSESN